MVQRLTATMYVNVHKGIKYRQLLRQRFCVFLRNAFSVIKNKRFVVFRHHFPDKFFSDGVDVVAFSANLVVVKTYYIAFLRSIPSMDVDLTA